jgi:hypothetical protein
VRDPESIRIHALGMECSANQNNLKIIPPAWPKIKP